MIGSILTCISAVAAQAPVDRYQQAGQEIGTVFNNIGAALNSGNTDAQYLNHAAQTADQAIANLRYELDNIDWSYLGPQAAQQQNANIQQYLYNLDMENYRLHALAQQATEAERAAMLIQPNAQHNEGYSATGIPKLQNKAVIKENNMSTVTESPAPPSATASATDAAESKSLSKESKSESKLSKEASKSESKVSKEASKSASKEAKSSSKAATATAVNAARNGTNATASAQPTAAKASGTRNAGTVAVASSGAILLAVLALI